MFGIGRPAVGWLIGWLSDGRCSPPFMREHVKQLRNTIEARARDSRTNVQPHCASCAGAPLAGVRVAARDDQSVAEAPVLHGL